MRPPNAGTPVTGESPFLPSLLDMQIPVIVVVAGGWWALCRPLLARAHYRWWAWSWTAFLVFPVGARISVVLAPEQTATVLLQTPAGMVQIACFALGAEALRRGGTSTARGAAAGSPPPYSSASTAPTSWSGRPTGPAGPP